MPALPHSSSAEPFRKLANPDAYTAAEWNLSDHAADREAWIDIFIEHTDSLVEHARGSFHPPVENALTAYAAAFTRLMETVRRQPEDFAPLSIYTLCRLRADMMREYGIGDPYDRVKAEENTAALRHLPGVLQGLDVGTDEQFVETLIRGVLAGNKFDLGAKETTEQYAEGGIDFFATLKELGSRPWFVDDVDALTARWGRGVCAYRQALYLVDNAGADVVLGAIPLARHLANEGCRVVLAANNGPALNDILVDELRGVLEEAARLDPPLREHLRAGHLAVVSTGCDCPLIDLGAVTPECNAAAQGCDLVILEGMGRAVETNWHAAFTCDAVHLAMIKNPRVAAHLGCPMFSLIARFTPKADG